MAIMDRRAFLVRSAGVAGSGMVSAAAVEALASRAAQAGPLRHARSSYGPPRPKADQRGRFILALPAGFSYVTFGDIGSTMSDGNVTPLALDGMAAFRGPRGTVRLIRNHEDRNPPGPGSVGGALAPGTTRPPGAARRRSTTTRAGAASCATSSRSTAARSTAPGGSASAPQLAHRRGDGRRSGALQPGAQVPQAARLPVRGPARARRRPAPREPLRAWAASRTRRLPPTTGRASSTRPRTRARARRRVLPLPPEETRAPAAGGRLQMLAIKGGRSTTRARARGRAGRSP